MPDNNSHDAFFSYSTRDAMIVNQLNEGLRRRGLGTFFADRNIPPGGNIVSSITKALSTCGGAVVFMSPHSAESNWVRHEMEQALTLLIERKIEFIIPVLLRKFKDEQKNAALFNSLLIYNQLDYSTKDLTVNEIRDELCERLAEAIRGYLPNKGENVLETPFVILAMTRNEAKALLRGDTAPVNPGAFRPLLAELRKSYSLSRLIGFYGNRRDDWRSPLLCQHNPPPLVTIKDFIGDVVTRLNEAARRKGSPHVIVPRFRSEEFASDKLDERTAAYKDLEDRCVLVADSLSLFHPDLANALNQSPIAHSTKDIIPIAVPPPYYRAHPIDKLLESAMKHMMQLSYDRFENLDKMCEFGISHPRGLRRWLFTALPEAAEKFNGLAPRDDSREAFIQGKW